MSLIISSTYAKIKCILTFILSSFMLLLSQRKTSAPDC